MNSKFIIALVVVGVALTALIYRATSDTAKPVVTIAELVSEQTVREHIRVGAKVYDKEVVYTTTPTFQLKFFVRDIVEHGAVVPVVYEGIRPDTFAVGRDVILEGRYDGTQIVASSLLTQCPSKYEVPDTPGAAPQAPASSYSTPS